MKPWLEFSDDDLQVSFLYPEATPSGRPVQFERKVQPDGVRVHMTSRGSKEIYFEVGRYPGMRMDQAMRRFLEGLPVSPDKPEISDPAPAQLSGLSASYLTVHWPDRIRWIYLVMVGEDTFRVILDPSSVVNVQVLDSLAFKPRSAA